VLQRIKLSQALGRMTMLAKSRVASTHKYNELPHRTTLRRDSSCHNLPAFAGE